MAESPRGTTGDTPREGTEDGSRRDAPRDASPGSRSMQTKAMHDSGQYRDKIPLGDPGASPLGTDSEASGFSAGEGSMEPTAPVGGAASPGTHPAGHARGDSPGETGGSVAKNWGSIIGIALLILAAVVLLFALF